MEISIPSKLYQIYKESRRNLDMALTTLLDSFNIDTYEKALSIMSPITSKEKGDMVTIKIGNSAISQVKDSFEILEADSTLISNLLWIAILFPEI